MNRIAHIITFFISFLHCTAFSGKEADYRYETLKKFLKKYQRSFTFMEVDAHDGELTFAVAAKFSNAVCIMSDHRNSDFLLEECKSKKELSNVVLIKYDFSVEDLERFGECEHIDVTYFSNVIKHHNWKAAIDAALTFGDYTILEAPSKKSDLHQPVQEYFKEKGGELLDKPSSNVADMAGPIYVFATNKKYLLRRRWNYNKERHLGEYTIQSSFNEKKLIKEKVRPKGYSVTDWHAGINLFTFKKLHGIYPSKDSILKMLVPLSTIKHNDLRIFNLIIQGEKLVPIDCDENGRIHTAKELLPFILSQFRHKNLSLNQLYDFDTNYLESIDNAMNWL